MNSNLHDLTIASAKDLLSSKQVSAVELTKTYLDRIRNIDETLNAFITVTEEHALTEAKKADDKLKKGEDLPLLGIPIVIKDNFCTKDILTTAASNVLSDFVPPYDATVVKKLKDAGAVILGKANMDAWAHGSSTETSDYGTTKNPWNTNHLPGGSSGGAAASIASDETLVAIGSETAGSIRQPASWCGVVGLKPTYGRVSRYGVIAMASSLDSPGPITKSVEDAAIVLNILAGKDLQDATTSQKPIPDYLSNLKKDIKGIRIGVPEEYFEGVESQVADTVKKAIKQLEELGAIIVPIKLFSPKYAIAVYTILQRSEVSSNLARYDGIRFGQNRDAFGEEAKRRIMLGTYALSSGYYDEYYKKAQKVRTIIIDDFDKAFDPSADGVDIIACPTSPTTALPVGASKNQPMFGEMADLLVEPSSIAGLPGISIPVGFSKNSLPIGMQLIGPQFSEEKILNVAWNYENQTEWRKRKPNL